MDRIQRRKEIYLRGIQQRKEIYMDGHFIFRETLQENLALAKGDLGNFDDQDPDLGLGKVSPFPLPLSLFRRGDLSRLPACLGIFLC